MDQKPEQSAVNPTYLEFFGLSKPPFAHQSDPHQMFHCEQYSVLMEHLVNASTNNDSLVVVCGADGSGKSMLLNRFIASLDNSIFCVAINDTCRGESQFYTTFLTQIGFADITGTENELRNITKEYLVCRGIAGDHVLIIIDNAHLIDAAILEQLQRLCEIRIKDRRVLSVVLAGNTDLIRVIDAPAMRSMKFSSHVVFGIRNFSEEETASYLSHRINLAGGNGSIEITDDSIPLIQRYTGGVPQMINTLGNQVLEEAHNIESREISESVVRTVADKNQLLSLVVSHHGAGRRKTDPDYGRAQVVPDIENADTGMLRQKIDDLSAELHELRAEKAQALQEIELRNNDISVLRDELAALQANESQSEKIASELEKEVLAREAAESELDLLKETLVDINLQLDQSRRECELANERIEAARSAEELEELERTSTNLAADLEKEVRARKAIDRDLYKATVAAEKRAAEVESLEKTTADLKGDVEAKSQEISSLREELELRNGEIDRVTNAANRLSAELKREIVAREVVENELAKATRTIDELGQRELQLRATVNDLNADLTVVGEKAIDVYVLEKSVTDLEQALEKANQELEARDRTLADTEKQLEAARADGITAKKSAESKTGEVDASPSRIVAMFEQSMVDIPAYETLRSFDPEFYASLIGIYRKRIGQELTDKEVSDALRAKQVELMERLLPGASDKAILAYARLMIEQLDELQLEGVEPCLTLLVPPINPDLETRPAFSERTKDSEFEVLDLTLKTFKENRKRPQQEDVWPDLEPLFAELFQAFGAENVAAMENSYDPDIDRILVCNVSRALYSGILNLPKKKAVNTLRWLLST